MIVTKPKKITLKLYIATFFLTFFITYSVFIGFIAFTNITYTQICWLGILTGFINIFIWDCVRNKLNKMFEIYKTQNLKQQMITILKTRDYFHNFTFFYHCFIAVCILCLSVITVVEAYLN